MISSDSFALFAELEANNNRAWFEENRERIHEAAVLPLILTLEEAGQRLTMAGLPLSGGAATLFRINRDIRFSKDKVPYKTKVSGLLTPDGSKSADEGVAYLQLDQRGGHMSAGYYNLTPEVLKRIRDRVVEHPDKFRKVLNHLHKTNLELTREMSLTGMPKGYSQFSGKWFAEYLKLKAFLVRTPLTKKTWTNGKVSASLADQTLCCAPLLHFGSSFFT